jgi:lipopolysaccharide export system protein LptA
MTFALLVTWATLTAPPLTSPAAAPDAAPVTIEAPEFRYSMKSREVVFTGNPVTLTRDDAKLTCKRLVAKNDANGKIAQATCSGDVRFVRGERVLTCDRALFTEADERIVCEGNPVLRDGATEARGTRLVYDLRADEARLEGARVTMPGAEVEARRRELEARRREQKK